MSPLVSQIKQTIRRRRKMLFIIHNYLQIQDYLGKLIINLILKIKSSNDHDEWT